MLPKRKMPIFNLQFKTDWQAFRNDFFTCVEVDPGFIRNLICEPEPGTEQLLSSCKLALIRI